MSLRTGRQPCWIAAPLQDGAGSMMVEQDNLEQQLVRALQEADATGDCLIAALLSQCLDLMHHRTASSERIAAVN